MDAYQSLSHTKWDCKYHVVFIPKCRRKTLYVELRQHLGEVFRQLAGQRLDSSTLSYEFPADDGDPYYPIPRAENRALYKRYEALAGEDPGVTFVGRLARYQYLNMDQVVGQALATFEKLRPRLVERDAALRPRPR